MNIRKRYIIDDPLLMQEWDYIRNTAVGLKPENLTVGSNKVAFWICKTCGRPFSYIIKEKSKGHIGCSFCAKTARSTSNRLTKIKNKASLLETHPDLCKEWVECLNEKLTPQDVTANSNKRVKWKCAKCGGIFVALIPNRTKKNSGCPYCAGLKVQKGVNDLLTVNPKLAKEWSDRNNLPPSEFLPFSSQKVYWKCPIGHPDYITTIKRRSYGQGCPVCARESQTSFPEQAIFYFIKQVFPDAENRYKCGNKIEVDIYIPSLKVGIEYNGYYAHKNREEKDKEKKELVSALGIRLFVVKECKSTEDKVGADLYISSNYDYSELDLLISRLLFELNTNIDVDTSKNLTQIREQYLSIRKSNSIVALMPKLLDEWDYEKNGKINPEFVSAGSNQRYYWKCPKCHNSYLAPVKRRSYGTGCPICSGKMVVTGKNDLATQHPQLLSSWDYAKNQENPNAVYGGKGSHKSYYWLCDKGHSYKCKLGDRIKGIGCPYCAGKKVLKGYNDLLTVRPDIVVDWDYEHNDILPSEIHFNSQSKVLNWKCHKCGTMWQSTVSKKGRCPHCKK